MKLTKEQRAEISRRNGAQSTGPLSPEGKGRVGRNAIRHGLLARTVLLKGESIHRFNRLCESLRADFKPEGPVETGLVETLVVTRWRQMRLWAFEKVSVDGDIDGAGPAFDGENPAVPAANIYRNRGMENISRYEGQLDRQYDRNLRTFQQHRKWRKQTQSNPAC